MTKEECCFDKAKTQLQNSPIFSALLEEDKQKLFNAFSNAKRNSDKTCFPDFVFDEGFIEHFQVTSSKEGRKGSRLKQKESEFKRNQKSPEELIAETSPVFSTQFANTYSEEMQSPDFSFEDFQASFKRNWEKHIESLDKYAGKKDVGIFLIEYTDVCMFRENTPANPYHLYLDKTLLLYVYAFRDKISFVVFSHFDKCETICVRNIPEIIKTYSSYEETKWQTGSLHKVNIVLDINFDVIKKNGLIS